MNMSKKVLLLPGDGIGTEIVAEAVKVIDALQSSCPIVYETELMGGAAIDATGSPFPKQTEEKAKAADAVLLGAVGGPKWDHLPMKERAEAGLLAIRKALGLYANLRPLDLWPPLADLSPLKSAYIKDVSFVVVRELTGDVYFGTPRGITGEAPNREGVNTMRYSEAEIVRIAHTAFKLAQKRRKKLCSVDKANVLESMGLWRQVVAEVHKEYPDVALSSMYVDNAAMQLIRRAADFDVILTPNMFGDILSDEASVLAGSLGLSPSASLGGKNALYEPISGSAPDIAGKGISNPIGTILSVAMMYELSFDAPELGQKIRTAIARTLEAGFRTPDIWVPGTTKVGTKELGNQIVKALS
jgi:3-isopropylmalate dehydrogenase